LAHSGRNSHDQPRHHADARATRDIAVLHASLDAVAAHFAIMEKQAAGCAQKMKGTDHMKREAPASEPQQPHAH
jgi:hypothetical protein